MGDKPHILDYRIEAKAFSDETIQIELKLACETLSRWVCNAKEEATRNALIKLGWTPPGEGNWLIWSNEHRAYWRPDMIGYTKSWREAGRFSRKQAVVICDNPRTRMMEKDPPSETMIPEECFL
jgi:hypothetical protein